MSMKASKSLILTLGVLVFISSCVKENELSEDNEGTGQELTFVATRESSDTRTVLQDGGKVFWSPNDSIALFVVDTKDYSYKKYTFRSTNNEPSASVTFKGVVDELPESHVFYAVHPVSAASDMYWNPYVDSMIIDVNIPSVQYSGDDGFNSFITIAESDSNELTFLQLMSGFSFSVEHDNIKSIELSCPFGGSSLSGSFSFEWKDLDFWGGRFDGTTTTIVPSQGEYFIPGNTYYAALPVRNVTSLKITYRTESECASYYHYGLLKCKRGTIYKLGARDKGLVFYPETTIESAQITDLGDCLTGDIRRVEFVASSDRTTDLLIQSKNYPVYAEKTGTTVRFYTNAPAFSTTGYFMLFYGIRNTVEYIDMGVFDFGKGDMREAFKGLKQLRYIDLSEVVTSNVADMANCFNGCSSLEELDLSSFNTSNVNSMASMFTGCSSLKSIDLSNFNSSNTQDMSGMFYGCRSLERIDVSSFDLSSVKYLSTMFYGCESLVDLQFSKSETPRLRSVAGMFQGCTRLSALDLSSLGFSGVESAMGMFVNCFSLTDLNLGEFNIGTVSGPNIELFRYVASASKSCNITCGREIMEKLLHEADEFDMFANSLRYINWYVPGGSEPVYRAPDYSGLYTSTDYSHDGEYKLLQTATAGKGIDIVIMGDYYTDRLIADGSYERDMQKTIDAIFIHEPFKSFRNLFNVYMVNVVSPHETDAGIGALESSTQTIIAQRVLLYAPDVLSRERCYESVFIVLANVDAQGGGTDYYYDSDADMTDYGSGLSTMFATNNSNLDAFGGTVIHEFGHAFGKLADEYWYDDNNELTDKQSVLSYHARGFFKNISTTNDPAEVPWSKFLSIDRYVNAGLGVFEGGYANYGKGVWRPTENSIMRFNTGGFNAPSREAIYYRIHKLAYGDDWEYSFEDFLEYDMVNFE